MKLEITEEQATGAIASNIKPKFGRIKPKIEQVIYFMDCDGTICVSLWDGGRGDLDLWAMGNVYLTREAAEIARDRQLAKVRVIDKLAELANLDTGRTKWGNTEDYLLSINFSSFKK